MELLERTGVGRDVNRHHYTPDEVERDLARPAVRAQLEALRARTTHHAFGGSFSWEVDGTRARLTWAAGDERAELAFDVADCSFAMTVSAERGPVDVVSDAHLGPRAG
jgi:sucrose phosphorylase